ncbi:hypothetical protein PGT21_003229 [Puccinia graminis f. sp. tritici]|uniref:Secreted protein n=1 Tax=Puccinia graminis f. sp. tritici TaxID=56615 RepID=A0A5B0QF07_PUCGR|nr:hypothetical protein PGT21_003229 [Puccinia graminis f. sp. tritici]
MYRFVGLFAVFSNLCDPLICQGTKAMGAENTNDHSITVSSAPVKMRKSETQDSAPWMKTDSRIGTGVLSPWPDRPAGKESFWFSWGLFLGGARSAHSSSAEPPDRCCTEQKPSSTNSIPFHNKHLTTRKGGRPFTSFAGTERAARNGCSRSKRLVSPVKDDGQCPRNMR